MEVIGCKCQWLQNFPELIVIFTRLDLLGEKPTDLPVLDNSLQFTVNGSNSAYPVA